MARRCSDAFNPFAVMNLLSSPVGRHGRPSRWALWLVMSLWLSACATAWGATPVATPTALAPPSQTRAATPTAEPSAGPSSALFTLTPTPTAPSPTPTPLPTATPLPPFQTRLLLSGVTPQTYLDACTYLRLRWTPGNAAPGTIVVPFMYHSVRQSGRPIRDNITVSAAYLEASLKHAHELGFQTITTAQLADFLHHNAYIPPRSLLIIVDDRSQGSVRTHFLPLLETYDWTLTIAYITGVGNEREWQEIRDLVATGRVEVQAHGFLHNAETYFTETTPEEILHQEIEGPIAALEAHLGVRPRAFIWPGGNFTPRAIQVARQAGYDLGFTAYARGPLMFNWIPLGAPEQAVHDPLMVLPRYWGTTAYVNLDAAVAIGEEARAAAEAGRAQELAWYRQNCSAAEPLPAE